MYFYENPTNTAARASNGLERSRWRDEGVDPELVADPFDVAAEARRCADEAEHLTQLLQAERPLSAGIAYVAMQHSMTHEEY